MHQTRQNLDDLESPSTQPVKNQAYLARLGSSHRLRHCPADKVRISDADIQPAESVRDLGVLINSAMTLTTHVNHLVGICFFHLWQIRIIRRSLSTDAAHSLVRALIHAPVDYCNGLLASCPKVRFKIGLLVLKCLHGLAPQYLSDYCFLVPVSSTRSFLRSAWFQERLLIILRTRTKTIGPRGFYHASPAIWNSLPNDLRDPELSIGCFRNKLKTFLISQILCLTLLEQPLSAKLTERGHSHPPNISCNGNWYYS